jgi:hypothetical protein
MGWLPKKPDPVTARTRALNAEIAALQQQIKKLDVQVGRTGTGPRLRPAAVPHGANVGHAAPPAPTPAATEPIFEDVNQSRLQAKVESVAPPEHFNELGVRKYDLAGLIARWKNNFRGPAASNPRLVNYLAAGGVQGLRPMRYEKRVARNRFIAFALGLFLLLIGILWAFLRGH